MSYRFVDSLPGESRWRKKRISLSIFFRPTNQEHINTECGRNANTLTGISTDATDY
jgi:hypothetical protein